jgi:membrane protease YdiL (CAAX protease family)
MPFGLIPSKFWHLLAIIPPIVLWWLVRPEAKRRHISRWHNASFAVSFWEEALFRGFGYGVILWLTNNVALTIVGSSLLFGLFHLRNFWWANRRQVFANCLYTGLIVGPIFALVRFWSGDIYLGILVHFLHNFVHMRFAHDTPTDKSLESKRPNQNWFERLFAGDWVSPANHHIIYLPGLRDQLLVRRLLEGLLPLFWRWHGFRGHILAPSWESGEFASKLQAVLGKIDELTKQGHAVSLVGQSAGSSLAFNAFVARSRSVTGLVILTGRLRVAGQPSLAQAAQHSPAFAQSVRHAEAALDRLSDRDRLRIITIRPTADKLVPPSSVPVAGATNLVSRLRGHSPGGAMLASFAAQQWLQFLKSIDKTDLR